MNRKMFIEDVSDYKSRIVKVRVDYNVPLNNGQVENAKRIEATLPTLNYLKSKGAKIVLVSHLGRPGGKKNSDFSLQPVAVKLSELMNSKVQFVDDCIGEKVDSQIANLESGDILLLENLRFYKEETDNDPGFSQELAKNVDIFVNDAFGTAHRAHASTHGITRYVEKSVCGYLLKKEIDYLGSVIDNPQKPFTVVSGGAKISDKILMIEAMLPKVDHILIGGGMAYTFLKAQGYEIGKSLLEEDKIDLAKRLLEMAPNKLILPLDSVCADTVDFKTRSVGELRVETSDKMGANSIGLDIGPQTAALFRKHILASKTVVWNGPMGVFEIEATAKGTFLMADYLKECTQNGGTTIVGGGDSASAVEKSGHEDHVSHVSTGGGASLELLEGKKLPGIEALSDI